MDTELSYVLNKANLEEYRRRGRRKLTITNLDVKAASPGLAGFAKGETADSSNRRFEARHLNTCDKCKALEGEVFFTEDVPVLPIHPRCHCAYCVPDDLDAAEVTASGEDLDAVYARHERPEGTKGVRSEGLAARSPLPAAGRGNGAVGVKGYGEDAPKQYVPKQQRAAEVARANGLIPASELQAKVEKAMAQTAPELAENGAAAAGVVPTAAGEMPTAAGEMPTDRKEVPTETLSTFGAPAKPDDVGVFGTDGIGAETAPATAEAQTGNPEKPDGVGILGLQNEMENDIMPSTTQKMGDGVTYLGKLNLVAFAAVSPDITTDDVIITEKQIAHSNLHEDAYEKYSKFIPQVVKDPDYIFADKHPNTGIAVKRIPSEANDSLQVVVRVVTSDDPEGYKNSVISCWVIGSKRLATYLRNRKILYKT